ncbi:hypothetical protein [Enterococcus avium]|uniref:hypothetical protein n=1 Tax=Enterococcus avium TaxID=33945 RepID=UPI001607E0BA|nr:hypothetical protein [Enterococcus avium]MDT2432205.1 hypothetical protein [Enterococcus avium]MDT2449885.1 hypothetical protein [Enterococcus avium]MDT2493825.1 hypothetical protein [Enterococcus avium]
MTKESRDVVKNVLLVIGIIVGLLVAGFLGLFGVYIENKKVLLIVLQRAGQKLKSF